MLAVITLNVDPSIEVGPLEFSWHGLMIALGVLAGGWLATRYARERRLDDDQLLGLIVVVTGFGIVGAKLLYLLQHDPGGIIDPGELTGGYGYSIYGGLVGGGIGAAVWLRWRGLSARYLDALAAGLPLGMAVGRVGDLINGEHYGPASDLPWAIVYSHPDALTPSSDVAYHPGGLYEVVLSLVILAVLWPLRDRFRQPTMMLWATIAAYAIGRFAMFFWRDDASDGSVGLNSAQLESLALIGVAVAGALIARRVLSDETDIREAGGP